jgi:hypothetical protein
MENILIEFQIESTHHFASHSDCFMGFVRGKNVPDTNGRELSPTIAKYAQNTWMVYRSK